MKKLLKRLLSVLLAVTVVIGSAPLSGLVGLDLQKWFGGIEVNAATVDSEIEISADETITVDIVAGEIVYVKFTPQTDGMYCFGSTSNYDTYGYLYDSDMKQLTSNDNGGSGGNFLIEYSMTAGQTYYYGVKFYSSSKSGSLTVSLSKLCSHTFTVGSVFCSLCDKCVLEYNIYNGEVKITDCETSVSGDILIPDTIDGYSVTEIGNNAFYKCVGITSITIPYGVTRIGECAFAESGLVNITIPTSVTYIGEKAFLNTDYYNDTNNWVDGIFYVGNNLVEASKSVSGDVTIANNVKSISDRAFANCINLTSVTIPDSVTSIGDDVFSGCKNLEYLRIPMATECGTIFGLGEGRSASEITIGNGEIIVEWSKGDQITVLDFKEDFTSFEIFGRVMGACGLVESINLSASNTSFKLIDGVLYDNDVTTLMIYPTASDKTTYVMPDTLENEYYSYFMLVENLEIPFSLIHAKNLDSLTLGANYLSSILGRYSDVITEEFSSSTTESEKMVTLFSCTADFPLLFMGWKLGTNSIKEFYVSENNRYLKDQNGMLCFKCDAYDVIICQMVEYINSYEFDGNDIVAKRLIAEIGEVVLSDEFSGTLSKLAEDATCGDEIQKLSAMSFPFTTGIIAESFSVYDSNKYFSVVDGVLFNKNETALLAYPAGSKRTFYEIPDVDFININTFSEVSLFNSGPYKNKDLTIHLPEYIFDGTTMSLDYLEITDVSDFLTMAAFSVGKICVDDEAYFKIYEYDLNGYNANASEKNSSVEDYSESLSMYETEYKEGRISEQFYNIMCEMLIYTKNTISEELAYADVCSGHEHSHFYKKAEDYSVNCTETIKIKYICSCGDNYIKEIPATGHNEGETVTENIVSSTCTESGSYDEVIYCTVCGEELSRETITVEALGHTEGEWTTAAESTCVVKGKATVSCSVCGEVFDEKELPLTDHIDGEWEITKEATIDFDGEREKKCTVCGKVTITEVIPQLETATVVDEESGISLEYTKEHHDGEVKVIVEESNDGTAMGILNNKLNPGQILLYDITMTVNGKEVQPEGEVRIRIPMPETYNSKYTFVYYVNTATGEREKIASEYVDGYVVFKTNHFSYYALAELSGNLICGEITSYNNEEVTVRLLDETSEVETVTTTYGKYSFAGMENGTYTLEVSAENHATRTYEVTVSDGEVAQDVKIQLFGDINGDGKVNTIDVARANAQAKGVSSLADYEKSCADINGDGRVNTLDVARMNAHAKGVTTLW